MEFTIWLEQFRAYYTSSRMDLCKVPEQQAYFKACLEPALIARIDAKFPKTMPVITPDPANPQPDALDLLRNEFAAQYPIVTRRLDLFKCKQTHGQTLTDWIQQLRSKGG